VPCELLGARLLLVDDEPQTLRFMERYLRRSGFELVSATADPRDVRRMFREESPDLIVLDLHMPEMDGFAVMEALQSEIPDGVYLPILVLTGDHDPELRQRALAAGARDFATKPVRGQEVLLRIKNLLETRFLHVKLRSHNDNLEGVVHDRIQNVEHTRLEVLRRLALAAEHRDDAGSHHAERVGEISASIAEAMALPQAETCLIRQAAVLHDVGKIGIPDGILRKPGRLSEEEFQVVKTHTTIGANILSGGEFPLLEMAREIAHTHHERWDGAGYPQGLSGEAIPLAGRIVAVADAFDSMTATRPHRDAKPVAEAVRQIWDERGGAFDPQVVRAFMRVLAQGLAFTLQSSGEKTDEGPRSSELEPQKPKELALRHSSLPDQGSLVELVAG
jgi:putative two-component system response regulator